MLSHPRSPHRIIDGVEGLDFVRCRICSDHRRVISGRHLSKHDSDRETYMQEYNLSPDELIAKEFRVVRSSRLVFIHTVRTTGLMPLRSFINRATVCLPVIYRISTHISTTKAYGFLVTGTRRFRQQILILTKCVYRGHGIGRRSTRSCTCEIEI